jgi:lipoprotein-anchoring transpeptidase ErfK/SrfK
MGSGRHAARGKLIGRIATFLAIVLILVGMLAGVTYAGYRYEQARAMRILPGVRIAGVSVGGMTRQEAERVVVPKVEAILDRQIDIRAGDEEWFLTAEELGTSVDLQRALDQALALSERYDWKARLYHRLLDHPVAQDIDLAVSYDGTAVSDFVQGAASGLERSPRDAFLDVVDGDIVARHSKEGQALAGRAAIRALTAAVHGEATDVDLTIRSVEPDLPEDQLGMTIIIRLSENKLYLYNGVKLVKTYPVATGQPGIYPTPVGHWTVVNKRINPSWVNPALDGWGADEPAFIPPGPDNPLGTRALDLDAPGIRIHGTPDDASIGHYASHGCIRMHIWDSEDLFGRVEVGTSVIIAY